MEPRINYSHLQDHIQWFKRFYLSFLVGVICGCARHSSQNCFAHLPGRWLVCETSFPQTPQQFEYQIIVGCTLDLQADGTFIMDNWEQLRMPMPNGRNFVTTNSVCGKWAYNFNSRSGEGVLMLDSHPVPTSGCRSLHLEAIWPSWSVHEDWFILSDGYRLIKETRER